MAGSREHDCVIIGGGIAGLITAERLAHAGREVLVLERYPSWGGRAVTYREHGLQYEIGAGRIFKDHTRVIALCKRFRLHTFPIHADSVFERQDNPNPFLALFAPIRDVILRLPTETLAQTTIADLVPTSMHPIFAMYPYYAELYRMRADCALRLFGPGDPMGLKDVGGAGGAAQAPFFGIREGIDALTTCIADAARKAGATLRSRYRVEDITRQPNGLFEITGNHGKKAVAKSFCIRARQLILATGYDSFSKFSVLRHTPMMKQLTTVPLMRIYAVYPPASPHHAVWFQGLRHTVTANRLRNIIPINEATGLIMISYTEGPDTDYWRALEDTALINALHEELVLLFPDIDIPIPTYVQKHDWKSGCTYWLPGNYTVKEASLSAHTPAPNLFVCGEAVSTMQTWIEGALESAELLERFV